MDKNISESTDLCIADLESANLSGASLSSVNLRHANLSGASLSYAKLSGADMRDANIRYARLINADLSNANLSYADIRNANLSNANLSNADMRNADISGADLSGADLTGALGLGSKAEEMRFAQYVLEILRVNPGALNMDSWHGGGGENECWTTHCLAGFYAPDNESPGAEASRALPTLAKYFYYTNVEARQALERVASGEESVFT
jgi:hypothetical protein